jgi:hypothetical protein
MVLGESSAADQSEYGNEDEEPSLHLCWTLAPGAVVPGRLPRKGTEVAW